MIRGKKDEWWHAYSFLGEVYQLFVGHRAPARISEVANKYPEMIETMRDPDKPRLYMYRFRHENFEQFRHTLPDDIKQTVIQELALTGRLEADRFV